MQISSLTSHQSTWEEVSKMVTAIVSLGVGVIAGIAANYIYDKYIK